MKKIFFIGLLAGLVMLAASMVWGQLSNLIWPQLSKDYQNALMFRPWSDPVMMLYFLHPFIVGVILAWLWTKTNSLFHEPALWKRGINFGFTWWVVTLSGMLISYSTFLISFVMVLSWSVNGLIQSVIAGLVFSRFLNSSKQVKTH